MPYHSVNSQHPPIPFIICTWTPSGSFRLYCSSVVCIICTRR